MRLAKTKALISFAVTAKLICVFVFAYADCWFSHEAAQLLLSLKSYIYRAPCIPLMQLNMLRHRLMQHFTRVGKNGER